MEAFKVPHMKRQGMSPPRVVQGRVPVQFGPNPATAGSLWRALRLSGEEALSAKKETLSHRGFQSATCETLGHPIICLAKGRAPVQFGPNPAAAGPSVVTP